MTKRIATLTVGLLIVLGIAAFTGSALAGNGNGNGNAYGNTAAQPAPAAEPASQGSPPASPGNSANAPGQVKTTSQGGGSADQNAGAQAGVKPTNATAKRTTCGPAGGSSSSATCAPTGTAATNAQSAGKSDASKRYGNGRTAAQIAVQNGATGATLYGPGNSQPHKAALCPGGKMVDVHALKAKRQKGCGAASSTKPTSSTQPTSSTHPTSSTQPTTSGHVTSNVTSNVTAGHAPAISAAASAPHGNAPSGGVLGATGSSGKAGTAGGVLGAIASVGQGVLPFTGFPLWLAVLAAVMMIVLGLTLRRLTRATV